MSYELHMTCLLCGGSRDGEGGQVGDERAGGGRWVERVARQVVVGRQKRVVMGGRVASSGGREGEGGQAGRERVARQVWREWWW
jgi:hypothetical protein